MQAKRLGEIFVEMGVLTPAQVEEALNFQARVGLRLGAIVARLYHVDLRTVWRARATQLIEQMPARSLAEEPRNPDTLALLSPGEAVFYELLPLRASQGRLTVATTRGCLAEAMLHLYSDLQIPSDIVLVEPSELHPEILKAYGLDASDAEEVNRLTHQADPRRRSGRRGVRRAGTSGEPSAETTQPVAGEARTAAAKPASPTPAQPAAGMPAHPPAEARASDAELAAAAPQSEASGEPGSGSICPNRRREGEGDVLVYAGSEEVAPEMGHSEAGEILTEQDLSPPKDIAFHCRSCAEKMVVPSLFARRRVRCEHCGALCRVPDTPKPYTSPRTSNLDSSFSRYEEP